MIWLWSFGLARAESWCAVPLVVHEWGVHVQRVDGSAPASLPLPSWFHDDNDRSHISSSTVRDLPADSGVRALPVLQFYAGPGFGLDVPVAVEVGFQDGEASSWWPGVDRRVPGTTARSVQAHEARKRLLAARSARSSAGQNPPLGPDPTKQLGWDHLSLTGAGRASAEAEQPWVEALRAVPDALWVSREGESDRFVYYEANTTSAPDLVISRAPDHHKGHESYQIRNRSDFEAHDIVVIAGGRVGTLPALPHGASATLVLDRPLDREALRAELRKSWLSDSGPPVDYRWMDKECVMMRDPAIPVEASAGHDLYGPELDVLFGAWADRLFSGDTPRVIYREDTDAIDARMPLSVYTDMYHFVELHRLGIVVVEGWAL